MPERYYTLYQCVFCDTQYRNLDECPNCGGSSAKAIKLKTNIEEIQEKRAKIAIGTVELILYRICSVLCAITFMGWICSPGMIIWTLIRQLGFKKKFDIFAIGWIIGLFVFSCFMLCFIQDTCF